MDRSLYFFLFALSFLSGVLYASLGLSLLYTLAPAVAVFLVLFAAKHKMWAAGAATLLLVGGAAYYLHDDALYRSRIAQVPQKITVQGVISADPKHEADFQSFYIKSEYGLLVVQTDPEPEFQYGDVVSVGGTTVPPTAAYYSKHVVGILRHPSITRTGVGKGNLILASLFGLKDKIKHFYEATLSPPQAALLFGIVFGDNSAISSDIAQELEVSGLRFITAIDGLHLQIMIPIIFGVLLFLLPRRAAYAATFVFIALFVALTSFTISGIRAALMALFAVVAKETGRLYLPHIILAFVALALTLVNPKVLLYDVGFQLSFLAVISIVYFLPALKWLVGFRGPGFLGWYESLLITICVQLFTAPLVITQFQSFSITSFFASVLVVPLLPYVLSLGFLLAGLASVLTPLAGALALIVGPLIDYVLFVVSLFAHIAISYNPELGFLPVALYYGALIACMYWYRPQPAVAEVAPPQKSQQKPQEQSLAAEFEIVEIE